MISYGIVVGYGRGLEFGNVFLYKENEACVGRQGIVDRKVVCPDGLDPSSDCGDDIDRDQFAWGAAWGAPKI